MAAPAAALPGWMVGIGILVPLFISAGRLLSAVTRGVAMTFAWPFCSPSVISELICAVPNIPVVKPMAVLAIDDARPLLIEPIGRLGGMRMRGSTGALGSV